MPTAIVISEGPADDAFLKKLIEVRGLNNLEVLPPGDAESYGDGGFQLRLEGLKVQPGVEQNTAIIIIADNDEDPAAAFKKIQKQIRDAGEYDVPAAPFQPSARGKYPPVAVVMLPAIGQQGSLDTLCLSTVNAKYNQQMACVEAITNCVGASEATWGKVKFAKLKVQCLLSVICKGDPYTPLKCAWLIEPRKTRPGDIFPLTAPAFNAVAGFLQQMSTL